ncbi:PIR Superfamily Protein [Plasmodium ovale wallikeri]|uniref:PIR Superfamily Protein n=1 Tax=Plasmodium ovale wallikeri TaxID=864142 RepID=A0A1A9AKU7_PLAOA|nr:PIR Superfamily Protein [Plasmodium ovale wallikeri]SBT57988.1 PIR Superfamily Protein [Plasmodium ovale wallikeri]
MPNMATGISTDDLPSKKYDKELKNGIHYDDIDKNIESTEFSSEDSFWSTQIKKYLENYVNSNVDKWTDSNEGKRCRDLNHILNSIIKKIKTKQPYNSSYDLVEGYINSATTYSLQVQTRNCFRDSKDNYDLDYIENKKNIDDLCEDITFIKDKFSEIHNNNCKQIESYIDQQITTLKPIYTNLQTKYSPILEYYNFKSFDDFNDTITKLKSKCEEFAATSSLVGHQGGMQQYSNRSVSIIAVTSLSGILSSFFLLYKTTSFGSILNNLVGKKIKFGNNLSDESYHETLEDISESSHDGGYNILYNSLGDS